MKVFKNEKGYTLLFTLAAIIIFTVLGLSLFTLTSSGLSRNEIRQSTSQSHDLAEKGITYFSELLNAELVAKTEELKNKPDKKNAVVTHFNTFANKYACKGLTSVDSPNTVYATDKFKTIESDIGTTKVCILKIEEDPTNTYARILTFKSIGTANSATTETIFEAKSEVGYSSVPEALNYAVSSNKGGNLYMFGGVQIEGNVKASNDIYVSDKAFWSSTNNPKWVQSVLPRVKSIDGIAQPKVFAKNIYRINDSSSNPLTPSSVITKNTPSITSTKITDSTISSAFHTFKGEPTPVLAGEKEDSSGIEVSNIVSTIASKANSKYNNVQISKYTGNFVRATTKESKNYEVGDDKALYISGHMNIGKYSLNGNYSNNTNDYNSFELNGNYYVEKDLVISGAKLKGNAVIYVKGSVDIEFSTINAGPNEQNNTIFIFAEKPIEIHNISVNSSPGIEGDLNKQGGGSVINGFFYTNSNFLMYGVGSNTRITGGVSAKHTTFTALRGYGVDELSKNQSNKTITNDSNTCTGINCSCELNNDGDRENSYLNQFEMIDKENLKIQLNDQKKKIDRNDNQWKKDDKREFNENINRIILLVDKPNGSKYRVATQSDIGKYFYITEGYNWSYGKVSQWTVNKKLRIVEKDYLFTNDNKYIDIRWYSNVKTTLNSIKGTNTEFNILYNILESIYGSNKNDFNDQCLTGREQNDKGKSNNNSEHSNVGGFNYTSRLTIVYNNDLIKRYTETNAIEVENAEIGVIPTNVKNLTIH